MRVIQSVRGECLSKVSFLGNLIYTIDCEICNKHSSTSHFPRFIMQRCISCYPDIFLSKWVSDTSFNPNSFCLKCGKELQTWQIKNKYRYCLSCYNKNKFKSSSNDFSDISTTQKENIEDCKNFWNDEF